MMPPPILIASLALVTGLTLFVIDIQPVLQGYCIGLWAGISGMQWLHMHEHDARRASARRRQQQLDAWHVAQEQLARKRSQ